MSWRRVERVDGLRRHQPQAAIDRLADPAELPLRIVCRDAHRIAGVVVPSNGDGAEVTPPVGAANLAIECLELGERMCTRIGTHPVDVAERLAQRVLERRNQFIHARLRVRAKALLDKDLADDLAERVGARLSRDRVAAAHPSGPHFFLATEDFAVEVEFLLVEARGEQRRKRVEYAPRHVGLPGRKRQRIERRAHVAEILRVQKVEARKGWRAGPAKKSGKSMFGAICARPATVVGLSRRRGSRNATRSSVARAIAVSTSMTACAIRSAGRDPPPWRSPGPTRPLARSSNIRCTCATYSLRSVVERSSSFKYRSRSGSPSAPWPSVAMNMRRIMGVGCRAEREKRREAVVREARGECDQLLAILDGRDIADQREDRPRPFGLDRLLIDTRRVGVADLLLVCRAARFLEGRVLENRANDANVSIRELVQPGVVRTIRGERMRREPVATGELVEIRAGVDAAIEVIDAEAFRTALRGRCCASTPGPMHKARCSTPNEQRFLRWALGIEP